jgi:hypothetical protein
MAHFMGDTAIRERTALTQSWTTILAQDLEAIVNSHGELLD